MPDAPIPPVELPEGRAVLLPGRGETFCRDTGGSGPTVLLLHGWMFSADTNWFRSYGALAERGYRVVALDHRGHGRGLRSPEPFRLTQCAGDAAALVRELDCGPVTAVGYSMGGPIAQLLARDHSDLVSGLVLCATAAHWQEPNQRRAWRMLSLIRLLMGAAPQTAWGIILRDNPARGTTKAWMSAELQRGSARDIAEAGRELSRYDARAWIGGLGVPAASVITAKDTLVNPRTQRDLAAQLNGTTFDVAADHMAAGLDPDAFLAAFTQALDAVAPVTA